MYRRGARGQQQETVTARIWGAAAGLAAMLAHTGDGGEGPVTKRGETFKTMIKRSCAKAASPQAALRGPIGAGNKGKGGGGRAKQKLASRCALCGDRDH